MRPYRMAAALAATGAMALATAMGFEMLDTLPLEDRSQHQVVLGAAQKAYNRQVQETFGLAEGIDPDKWFQVNLAAKANVNLFGGGGKTTPVSYPHMEVGRRVFYGVPFDVLDPKDNDKRTAIALPSSRLFPNELAPSVTVDVGRKAAVLYFLHTTWYTRKEEGQSYTFHYDDGSDFKVDFIGHVHCGDWWSPPARVYTEDVRHVLAPAAKGSKTFHRNMHVMQWRNPSPEKKIRSITFTSNPEAQMAIFVVAVTGHPGPLAAEKARPK